MKKLKKLIFVSLISIFSFEVGLKVVKAATVNIPVSGTLNYDYAKKIVELVNKERKAANVDPIKVDNDLVEAAMQRAIESVVYWDHTRPDGTKCYTINDKISGENIAFGSSTPEGAMQQWMSSQGHKENILRSSFKSMGVGVIKAYNAWFWVQVFSYQSATNENIKSGEVTIDNQEVSVIPAYTNYDFSYPQNKIVNGKITLNKNEMVTPQNHKFSNQYDYEDYATGKVETYKVISYQIPLDRFNYKVVDNNIASVSKEGTIKALKAGNTDLEVSLNGVKKTFPLEVISNLEDVEIPDITIRVGETRTLKYRLIPDDATFKGMSISSNNEDVVQIVDNKLVGKKTGSAEVVVKIDSETKTISKKITVTVVDYLKGDLNSDKVVDTKDAMEALYIVVGKSRETSDAILIGDLDNSNSITTNDAIEILRIYLKEV